MFLNVSSKVIGMQSLHDDYDRPFLLAVKTAAQSVVVPIVHRLAAGFGQCLIGL